MKDAVLKAATEAGGGDIVAYLTKQAIENPGPFLTLLGKVLPMQVTGDPEMPLVTRIELVAPDTKMSEKRTPSRSVPTLTRARICPHQSGESHMHRTGVQHHLSLGYFNDRTSSVPDGIQKAIETIAIRVEYRLAGAVLTHA